MELYPWRHGAIRREVLKALPDLLPSVQVASAHPDGRVGSATVDVAAEIVTPLGRRRRLFLQVHASPAPSRIREPLRQLKALAPRPAGGYPVFASRFLSPRVRAMCREEGVGYVDLAGNCLLHFDDLHVEKIVDANPFPRRGRPPSLFAPVSSRIVRALLEEPRRGWTVSELAAATRVSLGQTSNVTRRLLDEAYLARTQRRLRLVQPAQLLEAWREQYAPQQHALRAYYSFEADLSQRLAQLAEAAQAHQLRYAVTSFAAASLLAPFVRGIATLSCYVEETAAVEAWVRALDLRPVEEGPNVLLLVPADAGVFYRSQTVNGIALVGTTQLYLDLYSDPARGREQAEVLRRDRMGF